MTLFYRFKYQIEGEQFDPQTLHTESYNKILKGVSYQIDFLNWIQGHLLKTIGNTGIKNPDYLYDEV